MSGSGDCLEVCLIDAGISSLTELKLPRQLLLLNLHCNCVKTIAGINHLKNLKHLDLSSNEITTISGLSQCGVMQTLNLSCNCITKVEGVEKLRSLKHLNVSFNNITDISGLRNFTKRTHKLCHLDIYGNKITSVKHITQSLISSTSLTTIYFKKDNISNPVCNLPAYRPNLMSQMPWLENLDGIDKYGQSIEEELHSSDIPGLEEYLELLQPTSISSSVSSNDSYRSSLQNPVHKKNITTSKIDSVLQKFKERPMVDVDEKDCDDGEKPEVYALKGHIETNGKNNVHERLESLENKLTTLVNLCTDNQLHNVGGLDAGVDEVSTEVEEFKATPDSASESKSSKEKFKAKRAIHSGKPVRVVNKDEIKVKKSNIPHKNHNESTKIVTQKKNIRSTKDDETYLLLMNEIETERERRWKAEQASRKLLDNIKLLQERSIEDRKIQEAAIMTSTKMKKALAEESDTRMKLEKIAAKFENDKITLKDKVCELQRYKKEAEEIIKALKESSLKLEKEKLEEEMYHNKRWKELQLDSGGTRRELELLRSATERQKEQIQQLQELMVVREQEHQAKTQKMVHLEGKEVKELLENEISKFEGRNSELMKQVGQRLNERNIDYQALEDEFRLALQIEANRYNELHSGYEDSSRQLDELKSAYEELSQKEAKGRNLVTELSSLVKEQKTRITEIVRSKHEMQIQFKERFSKMEEELIPLRKLSFKFESLQQDKDRMAAHIKGQESVIHGLRSERKLWGQELAQQGASLAQERGRLDAQVEAQLKEISLLQIQLKDCKDTLKIKCKLIDDQTDTIKQMKQDWIKLTEDHRRMAEDEKREMKCLYEELEKTKEQNIELHESIECLTDRKEELKAELARTQDELSLSQGDLRKVTSQWEERSKVIDQFETKVVQMKLSYETKEKNNMEERKKISEELKTTRENFKSLEKKHDLELGTMKHDHQLEIRKVNSLKDDELKKAKRHVSEVEEEMRALLTQCDAQKKHLEVRVQQLSNALTDIQRDLK